MSEHDRLWFAIAGIRAAHARRDYKSLVWTVRKLLIALEEIYDANDQEFPEPVRTA